MAGKRKAKEYDCSPNLIEVNPMDVRMKIVAANVSPCVVGVASFGIGEEVAHHKDKIDVLEDKFSCSGIIIECEDVGDGRFFSTILTHATLFIHSGLEPKQVKVLVYLSHKWCSGELLACDFHYNLAALRIQSNSPLQAAKLRGVDDVLCSDPTELPQLRPHTKLFRLLPGTKIINIQRPCTPRPQPVVVYSGVVSMRFSFNVDCNEVCSIDWLEKFDGGGPVCNYLGEVIGILFNKSFFLPINIVSRWWNHYKSHGESCRPWLGLKVGNLYAARLDFRQKLLKHFPNVSTGVIVGKIVDDSAAYRNGIRPKDVIVKCDGKLIRSILEFFEKIWEKAGKSVELTVLRVSDGSQFNRSINVGVTAQD